MKTSDPRNLMILHFVASLKVHKQMWDIKCMAQI